MDKIFTSQIGKQIHLTEERKQHILKFHPEIKFYLKEIAQVLSRPNQIRRSKYDKEVLLFYKYFPDIKKGKYLVVVVKINKRSFVLTAYLTNQVITGSKIYEQA